MGGLPCCGIILNTWVPKDRSISINETHVFSPHLVNEFRFGWNWNEGYIGDPQQNFDYASMGIAGYPAQATVPNVSINNYAGVYGYFKKDAYITNNFPVVDNLTLMHGAHTIKFGGEFRYLRATRIVSGAFIPNVTFSFDGRYTGYAYADFLLGDLAGVENSLGRTLVGMNQPSITCSFRTTGRSIQS